MANIINLLIISLCTFCLLLMISKYSPDPDRYPQNHLNSDRKQANKDKDWEAMRKDITAIPAMFNGRLYYPLNGDLYAVNPMGGIVIWKKNLQELTGISPTGLVANANGTVLSVATPIVACDLLIVGIYGPAVVVAVKICTGELVWSTRLSSHVASVVAMSGIFHQGFFYVGTSSLEERLPVGQCCTFRGSFYKLNASTGAVLWQTYMLPDNVNEPGRPGYAGAALWRSIPAIDELRNQIYAATGKLYSAPLHVHRCQMINKMDRRSYFPDKCLEPENRSDSILALDLDSGKVKWSHRLWDNSDVGLLTYNDHYPSSGSSPTNYAEDNDFYEPPMVLTVFHVNETTERDIVIANHRSGFAWALDRDNGDLIWFREPTDMKAYLAEYGLY